MAALQRNPLPPRAPLAQAHLGEPVRHLRLHGMTQNGTTCRPCPQRALALE